MRHVLAHVALANGKVGNAHLVPRLEAHRLPDAAGHKARTPVPAVLVGGLADISLRLGLGLRLPRIACGGLGGGLDRRWERPRAACSCRRADGSWPARSRRESCCRRSSTLTPFSVDLGGRIQTVEDQIDVASGRAAPASPRSSAGTPSFPSRSIAAWPRCRDRRGRESSCWPADPDARRREPWPEASRSPACAF